MKNDIKKIKNYYLKLTERKKILLKAGVFFLIPFISHIFVNFWKDLAPNSYFSSFLKKNQWLASTLNQSSQSIWQEVYVSGLIKQEGILHLNGTESLKTLVLRLGVKSNYYLAREYHDYSISNLIINNRIDLKYPYIKKIREKYKSQKKLFKKKYSYGSQKKSSLPKKNRKPRYRRLYQQYPF